MYEIYYYVDERGNCPVKDFIKDLSAKNGKNNRIQLSKILDYIRRLGEDGTQIGEPYIKHLDGQIWELRPARNRVLFAYWYKNSFVLLHPFAKKTQKTPRKEIEKAKQELKELLKRGENLWVI